eukprot:TRINITY_DN50333_c0_g1_i1.p1 TRINITY_DN50333_c0_g1~~TRINITY_DN50333_c0_g1_i1.p1  ORF type:complete len:492 (-),score=78.49 TRINITY_DN50333_c0_g1_i1:105-1580(-)
MINGSAKRDVVTVAPVGSSKLLGSAPTVFDQRTEPAPIRDKTSEFLLQLCCAVDAADKALLPATYQALQLDLHVSPTQLGSLSLCQSMAFSLALPFWGAATAKWSPRTLLVAGCVMWAVATGLLAFSLNFKVHCILRVINGIGLCGVMPVSQSMLAGIVPENERGFAFGKMQAFMTLASMFASWIAVIYQGVNVEIFNVSIKGWQLIYAKIAMMSLALAVTIHLVMPSTVDNGTSKLTLGEVFASASRIVRIPSFMLLVLQGMVGGVPWNAMAFLTLYWQSCGYSNIQVGRFALLQGGGAAIGAVLGGMFGDRAAIWSPNRGRVFVAILSVCMGLPLYITMFVVIPPTNELFYTAATVLLLFSLVSCWVAVAANKPICAELVSSPMERAQIVALWVMIEGVCASLFGAPLVGRLSEHFGYHLDAHGRQPSGTAIATALGKSLAFVGVVAWTFCALIWIAMLFVFPKDRARAQVKPLEEQCMPASSYSACEK